MSQTLLEALKGSVGLLGLALKLAWVGLAWAGRYLFTFSAPMPLVIDMTLNGPLNRVPRRRVEKETVGTLINQLNLGQPDTLN